MKIVVLIKPVPDTWGERRLDATTGRIERNPRDLLIDDLTERALEAALQARTAHGGEVIAVLMAPEAAKDIVAKVLAIGADRAVLIVDDALAGSDLVRTARELAAAIRAIGPDLVLGGAETTDGRGGAVPGAVAELLGLPLLGAVDDLEITATGVAGTRITADADLRLAADLPAIATVTERAPDARFPGLRDILGAKKKPVDRVGPATGGVGAASVIVTAQAAPARTAGTRIVDDGTAADQIVDFLAARGLV